MNPYRVEKEYGLSEKMAHVLTRAAIESLRYLDYAPESEWGWGIGRANPGLNTLKALKDRLLVVPPEREEDYERVGYFQPQYGNQRRLGWTLSEQGIEVAEALYEKYVDKSYKKAKVEAQFADAAHTRRRQQKQEARERRAKAVASKLSGILVKGGIITNDPHYEGRDAAEYVERSLSEGMSVQFTLEDMEKIVKRFDSKIASLEGKVARYREAADRV